MYYAKRIPRLSGSPRSIAIGVAAGVFASFTPFIGFHFILGFVMAFVLGGNLIASALGTAAGNPFTFPLIWASTYRVGSVILGQDQTAAAAAASHVAPDVAGTLGAGWTHASLDVLLPLIGPMVVGAIPLGSAFGLATFVLVFYLVRGFKRMRAERLARRREDFARMASVVAAETGEQG